MEAVSLNGPPNHAAHWPLWAVTIAVVSTLLGTMLAWPCVELVIHVVGPLSKSPLGTGAAWLVMSTLTGRNTWLVKAWVPVMTMADDTWLLPTVVLLRSA